MSEEEVVNPKPAIFEACKPACEQRYKLYNDCTKRIANDKTGDAHCSEWWLDYIKCMDKCVMPKLWSKLK